MAEDSSETQEPKSLDVLYTLAARQLEEQLKELEGIDTKLGVIFGVSSVILGLLLTSLPSADQVSTQRLLILIPPWIVYLTVVVMAVLSYRLRSVSYPPDVRKMYEEALFWDDEITRRQVLATWVSAIGNNAALIRGKAKWAGFAIYLLAAEAVLATLSWGLIHLI